MLGLFVIPTLVCEGRTVVPVEVVRQGPLHEKSCEVHPAIQVALVLAVALGVAFGVMLGVLFGALFGIA